MANEDSTNEEAWSSNDSHRALPLSAPAARLEAGHRPGRLIGDAELTVFEQADLKSMKTQLCEQRGELTLF